jgi:hypothetical protein
MDLLRMHYSFLDARHILMDYRFLGDASWLRYRRLLGRFGRGLAEYQMWYWLAAIFSLHRID